MPAGGRSSATLRQTFRRPRGRTMNIRWHVCLAMLFAHHAMTAIAAAPTAESDAPGRFSMVTAALQQDGKVLLGGAYVANIFSPHYRLTVVRLTPDGALDTTFGGIGY